jgi:hypothetical protein
LPKPVRPDLVAQSAVQVVEGVKPRGLSLLVNFDIHDAPSINQQTMGVGEAVGIGSVLSPEGHLLASPDEVACAEHWAPRLEAVMRDAGAHTSFWVTSRRRRARRSRR